MLFHDLRFGSSLKLVRAAMASRPNADIPFRYMAELEMPAAKKDGTPEAEVPPEVHLLLERLRFTDSGKDSHWQPPQPPASPVLTCAKIGGIMAAKRVGEIIPLCHPLSLTYADIRFEVSEAPPRIRIEAETRTVGNTGVEMEAIVAAQTAAAVIYDMCKAVQRDIIISRVRLLHKRGGKSGEFNAPDMEE